MSRRSQQQQAQHTHADTGLDSLGEACVDEHVRDAASIVASQKGPRGTLRRAMASAGINNQPSWTRRAKNNLPLAFLIFMGSAILQLATDVVFAPLNFVLDPLSTVATLIVYPFIAIFLASTVVIFMLGKLFGVQARIDSLCDKMYGGWSFVQWFNPEIFGPSSVALSKAARPTLAGDRPTIFTGSGTSEVPDDANVCRVFDVSVAKFLATLSSLVYEREDKLVAKAAKLLQGGNVTDRELKAARGLMLDSERRIRDVAATYNLNFLGVSELSSISGPFAGLYYTKPDDAKPFMLLVFKGTTPYQYSDFLTDLSINRTSARATLGGGAVHTGFFTSLFPDTAGPDGYGTIRRTLRTIATSIKKDKPVNLFIAGHSLGAALATICYTRMLNSPGDLGNDIVLRDAYTIGCPRTADGDLASTYEGNAISPIDRPTTLWRIVNSTDVVTMIPPGLADRENKRNSIGSRSTLNFAHMGAEIHLTPYGNAPRYVLGVTPFHSSTKVIVGNPGPATAPSAPKNSVQKLLAWIPAPLRNHFPALYIDNLNRIEQSSTTTDMAPPSYEKQS